MGKLDDLRQKVSDAEARFQSLRDSKQALKRKLREAKIPITLAWADIEATKAELKVALEAESAKPREWNMFIAPSGYLMPNSMYLGGPFGKAISCSPITVREVKPLVITREMAEAAYKLYSKSGDNRELNDPTMLADVLKAAGIDAIPEPEKGDA